ncbi:hypothetical protein BKA62DRAFT_722345 [Auriculariales sp. MPI-PUGE-AT-0066]|nr:hypothetical protein BKA62DRAFT_722345 [Auriculariales sp. MPI-PUGE-AT-0066]
MDGFVHSAPLPPVIPLTAHILTAAVKMEDGSYQSNGEKLTMVSVVGRVTHILHREMHIDVTVEDGTGLIHILSHGDPLESWTSDIELDLVYSFYGLVRTFLNTRCVVVDAYQRVTDANAIIFHFLDAIRVNMLTRTSQVSDTVPAATCMNDQLFTPVTASIGSNVNDHDISTDLENRSNVLQRLIHDVIKADSTSSDRGCSLEHIAQQVQSRFTVTAEELNASIEELTSVHGLIYEAADELHFHIVE